MREPQPVHPSPGAAGTLLIAHPGLLDPNFRKTVLLISSWSAEEGAFGLVLNRPANRTVAELLPDHPEIGALGQLPVFHGGPVSRDQLIFASFHWHGSSTLECRHHMSIGAAEETAREPGATIRAFIGYAGWSKGQLEAELAQHAWLLKPPDPDFMEKAADGILLWRDLLGTFGPKFRLVADAPDDPSRN